MTENAPHVEAIQGRRRVQTVRARTVERLDEQLQLASQVQRDLLPDPMPASCTARFHALYIPADHVSGDIYDVVRLDESHLAVSLADATGHGIPAALLTVFMKQSFRGKAIDGTSYRILNPAEVLSSMNRELMETGFSHCQFVTALHAVYNERRRCLCWARGGVPYPVFVRSGVAPALVRSTGVLLGAVDDPPFEVVELALRPGDRIYFHTDGLDALLCRRRPGEDPSDISSTPWFASLPERKPEETLAEVAAIRRDLAAAAWPYDDITVVCLECTD